MSDIRTYKMKGSYKGIDDMPSIYAFHGNSQGDDSCSNDVNDYIGSQGWMSVSSYFKDIDYTNQEEVNKRSNELKLQNENYIQECKNNGTYGDYNGDISLSMKYMPQFDDPSPIHNKGVESYRMTFIDFSKDN